MKKYSLIICLLLCLTVLCSCATKQDIDTSSGAVSTITEKADTSTIATPDVSEDKEPTETQKKPSQAQESVENGKTQQTEESKSTITEKITEETDKPEKPKQTTSSESTVVSKPTTKPTEETTSKPTETEPPKETTESTVPEIVRPTGIEVAQRVIYYINQHRETQGSAKLTAGGAMVLSVGLAIQNFPEGAIISMPLRADGMSKPKAFLMGVLSGAAEPVGAILTILAAGLVIPAMPYLLSFAAGAMIYVVVEELIPEMSEGEHSNSGVLMFCAGFTLMMALDVALG